MPPLPPVSSEEVQNSRRSEEHTSELQSQSNLVCRLLLEKKKNNHREQELPKSVHRELLPSYVWLLNDITARCPAPPAYRVAHCCQPPHLRLLIPWHATTP